MLRRGQFRPCGRAEPARPRGGEAGEKAYRGKARDDAEGGFLGGARSPRPRGKAGRKPRRNMIIGSKGTPGGLAGPCVGQARAFPSGVRSPPFRRIGDPSSNGLAGKARDDAKGGFLGGARSPRPYGQAVRKPGHNKIIGGKRIPGGQMGTCSGEANSVLAGVRSPPLRRIGDPSSDGLAGKGRK